MDFGRVSLDSDLILYLFGTPGQHRFWFMWDDLVRGAIGAVVLVDTRRLADAFASIDFFDDRQLPYVVAVNCFDGMLHHRIDDVRDALTIDQSVPIVTCDARNRESTKQTLITLVEHSMRKWMTVRAGPAQHGSAVMQGRTPYPRSTRVRRPSLHCGGARGRAAGPVG
jgi:hypothetical protein